jgi:hypothetical protein
VVLDSEAQEILRLLTPQTASVLPILLDLQRPAPERAWAINRLIESCMPELPRTEQGGRRSGSRGRGAPIGVARCEDGGSNEG